jgi:hypothetical protein
MESAMVADRQRYLGTRPQAPFEASGCSRWVPLVPAAIVSCGADERATERLIGLQSAIGKAVQCAVELGRLPAALNPARMSRASRALLDVLFGRTFVLRQR